MNICICTICKNESKHVKRWYDSCKDADSIVVLDTGSTDNTVELFEQEGVKPYQKTYEKFRWDVARNDSMKYIPSDADIILFLDLDETLEPDWRKVIEENWVLGKHTQAKYDLSQDNPEAGLCNQTNTWMISNDPQWYWKYPIHEELWRDDINEITPDRILDLRQKFTVHHFPDLKKKRDWYNPMFEERLKEYPNQMSRYYYANWLCQNPQTKVQGINEYIKIINEPNDHTITAYERAEAARNVAIAYYYNKDYVNCENSLKRGIQIAPTYSILYYEYAKLRYMMNDLNGALYLMDKAIEYNDSGWIPQPDLVENLKKVKEYMKKNPK